MVSLLRSERLRQWLTLAIWSPALVLTFGTVLLLEFASLTSRAGLGNVPAGPHPTSTRSIDLFDTLTAVWVFVLFTSPVLALCAWVARRMLVRTMESRIAALRQGWQGEVALRPGRVLGTFRLARCEPGRVRIATTPCSWLVRWMFEKFFAAGTVMIMLAVVTQVARGSAALPGIAEVALVLLVLVIPACIGGFLLARIEWTEVRERNGKLEVARGLTVFMLPLRGGWRPGFIEADKVNNQEDDDAKDCPPSWYLLSAYGLTTLDLWHVAMLRAAIARAFPNREPAPRS